MVLKCTNFILLSLFFFNSNFCQISNNNLFYFEIIKLSKDSSSQNYVAILGNKNNSICLYLSSAVDYYNLHFVDNFLSYSDSLTSNQIINISHTEFEVDHAPFTRYCIMPNDMFVFKFRIPNEITTVKKLIFYYSINSKKKFKNKKIIPYNKFPVNYNIFEITF